MTPKVVASMHLDDTGRVRKCRMCGRSRDGLTAWHVVVHESLVSAGTWEEITRIEVCSWACLRLAYMADEPGEPPSPESWK